MDKYVDCLPVLGNSYNAVNTKIGTKKERLLTSHYGPNVDADFLLNTPVINKPTCECHKYISPTFCQLEIISDCIGCVGIFTFVITLA